MNTLSVRRELKALGLKPTWRAAYKIANHPRRNDILACAAGMQVADGQVTQCDPKAYLWFRQLCLELRQVDGQILLAEQGVQRKETLTPFKLFGPQPVYFYNLAEPKDLPSYLKYLNREAEAGELPQIIGRTNETTAMIQKLTSVGKKSFVVVGKAGVGKTTVARGLVNHVKGRIFVELNLPEFLSGAAASPAHLGKALSELRTWLKANQAVLLIDEICSINQLPSPIGEMFWNALKSDLAEETPEKQIVIIGTTTPEQYNKYIVQDETGLARRFPMIEIDEPSPDDTIQFLASRKSVWEAAAGIKLSFKAIRVLVTLAHRYLVTEAFPDKALTIMGEIAAAVNDRTSRKLRVLSDIAAELVALLNNALEVRDEGDAETSAVVNAIIKRKLKQYEELAASFDDAISTIISPAMVQAAIAEKTGIPVAQLSENERDRLLRMAEIIGQRVIGQAAAKKRVVEVVTQSRLGLRNPERPAGVFMFLGPTGVGKTELARELARFLFLSEDNLVRLDMSEFQQPHDAKNLTGAPPSYVGFGEPGKFEPVRRRHYTVVLFDEIEKAHPNVWDILLQILDHGKCTDGNRVIDFSNSYIIMTSNLNEEALKRKMRPELLGRIGQDNRIVFEALTLEDLCQMVDIHTRGVIAQVYEKGYHLELSETANQKIAQTGYDPTYGARPLKDAIAKLVEQPLSRVFLMEQFSDGSALKPGDTILVDLQGDRLVFVKGEAGKYQPPKVSLSPATEAIWTKLDQALAVKLEGGEEFEMADLKAVLPLLAELEKKDTAAVTSTGEEEEVFKEDDDPPPPTPGSFISTPARPKISVAVPPALSAPPTPLPPPIQPAAVEVDPSIWEANSIKMREAALAVLRETAMQPLPTGYVSKAKLVSYWQSRYPSDTDLEQRIVKALVDLFNNPFGPDDISLKDALLSKNPQSAVSNAFGSVANENDQAVVLLTEAIAQRRQAVALTQSITDNITIMAAIGTADDLPYLQEIAKYYNNEEARDWRMENLVKTTIIAIAKRAGQRQLLLQMSDYKEAIEALAELAVPADLVKARRLVVHPSSNYRQVGLAMLAKIGSREDLPLILQRIKTDTADNVVEEAGLAFAALAKRDDLEIARELAQAQPWQHKKIAGLIYYKIAQREDFEELKLLCNGGFGAKDFFMPALQKIMRREDLDFPVLQTHIKNNAKGGYSSGGEVTYFHEAQLEVFPSFAQPSDLEFVKQLLKSKYAEHKIIGFQAYCRLLTQFDIAELNQYIIEANPERINPTNQGPLLRANIKVAEIAARRFGDLAGEESQPEIFRFLRSSVGTQQRAAFWALSRPDIFTQIPPSVKMLLRRSAQKGAEYPERYQANQPLLQALKEMLEQSNEIQL